MESYLLPILGAVILAAVVLIFSIKKSPAPAEPKSKKEPVDGKVHLDPAADAAWLVNHLRPTSSPLDVLYAIATTPDQLKITQKHLDLRQEAVDKKLAALSKKSPTNDMQDLLADDGGWAEEDDDPATTAAKKAAEQKEKEAKQLAAATGKEDVTKLKLEGIDDGVLGAEWVERQCAAMKCWPPPQFQGDLTDGAVKRNLLMTMGRLHAKQLNNHPELLQAGPLGNIDPTYFQGTIEYRSRVGQLLEATLRMACTLRSFRLANSVLDAMIMFKIGVMDVNDEKERAWFADLMKRQYGEGGTPKLIFGEKYLGVPTADPNAAEGEEKDAEKKKIVQLVEQTKAVTTADEKMALEMHISRQHAEAFTKEKLAQCQKQGIPPQIGMNAYRETWFIMVRARKLDGELSPTDKNYGDDHLQVMSQNNHQLYQMLEPATIAAFQKEFAPKNRPSNRMVIGWPFQVANIAQKAGKVKMHLVPPQEEGKYEFTVTIKSQDFLGVDDEFKLVLDVKKGVKKEEEEEEESEGDKKNN
ncbi:hypothetical protein HJC23_001447 [Cyclotella cryptica]|uniref:SEC63 domain-containing protein n=1 Tax=Cyclotella cryptica TaxID=29204 RepID=A0ABD3PBF3_9STRA|eukprot:CCRYP_016152-RA/>CCRYP_016152-RA protein AED:0.14 eAED:0.14 QI:131/-1/1/1/-1/1/1/1756/526